MSNHYTQMDSKQRTMELGDMQTNIMNADQIQVENITDTSGYSMTPVFRNIRTNHGRPFRWHKILLIMIFILVLVLLTLVIIFMASSYEFNRQLIAQKNEKNEDKVCLTFACLRAAVDIAESINVSVNPCTDFHQFACGRWENSQVLPKGTSRYGTFDVVNDELYKIQKKLLENQIISDPTSSWAKAIRLYNSCNDIDTINSLGDSPLKTHMSNIFNKYGGWDMLTETVNFPIDTWTFPSVVEDPNVLSPIFKLIVYHDEKDSKKNAIYLYLSPLMIEKQYLQNYTKPENRKIIDAYLEYMRTVGNLLGVNKSKMNQFDNVLKLEMLIATYHPSEEDQRDPDSFYNKVSVSTLQTKLCPLLNWTSILRNRFQLVNISLPDDMEIIVRTPKNLKQICDLFQTYTVINEKKLILHNYIVWNFVNEMTAHLSQEFINAKEKFNKVYTGTKGSLERWETCVSIIQQHMGYVLGNMFIRQKFDKRSKPQVLEMIMLIKNKFRENLLNNEWMDKTTIKEALKKINSMFPIIGYTGNSLNETFIAEYYSGVEISNTSYYDNIYRLNHMIILKEYGKLYKPENTSIETPQEVNAFYSPSKNEIIIPAGILRNPFFDPGFPRSLKYGAIGSAIGHEITHGFDDSGSKFDSRGNLRNWWTNATRELFKTKADCFVKQYSGYSLFEHSINGLNTLGENIADNGGLRLTHQVFKYLENKFGVEKPLPGLPYSHDQLFFISFARIWCNLATKERGLLTIFSNSHTPNLYRIIGVLSNFDEFAEAFKCQVGSPMNPTKKCIVW